MTAGWKWEAAGGNWRQQQAIGGSGGDREVAAAYPPVASSWCHCSLVATGVLHCSQGVAAACCLCCCCRPYRPADLQLCSLRYLLPVQESATRWSTVLLGLSLSLSMPQQELLQLGDATAWEFSKMLQTNLKSAQRMKIHFGTVQHFLSFFSSRLLSLPLLQFFFLANFFMASYGCHRQLQVGGALIAPTWLFLPLLAFLPVSSWISVFLAKTSFRNWFFGSLPKRFSLIFIFLSYFYYYFVAKAADKKNLFLT